MDPSPHAERRGTLATLPRNVWIMTLTSFLTDISSEMIFNLVPLFLANVLHAPTSVIGLIEGVAETTASVLKTFSGWLSDRLGTRKWLTVGGYGLSALSKPFLYIASTWWGVFAVRFADRVGKGIRTAPRDALIADSIDEHHRGIAFGLHRAGDTAGAVVGLLVALAVVSATQSQALGLTRETFQTLVVLSVIPAFLAVIALAVGVRETPIKRTAERPKLSWSALNPRFRAFLLIVLLFTLGNSSDAFLVLRAQERGLNVIGILGMLVTFNVVYAVISGPAGALSDRIGRYRLIVFGWLAYGLLYLGFALATSGTAMWLVYTLYGVYYGTAEGTAKALVADLVPSEQRGTAYGVYNTAVGLAALPASVIAGILWQSVSPTAPFVFGAVMALAAVVALTMWQRGGESQKL